MPPDTCTRDHINDLGAEIFETSITKGWNDGGVDKRTFGDMCMLLVSEVSEALEEYRSGRGLDETYYRPYTNEDDGEVHQKPEGIPVELADVAIRLFYMAHIYGVDLEAAIPEKVEFNKKRSFKHGGKLI